MSVECKCGCGEIVNPGRKYINGHYWIGKKRPDVAERLRNNHHFKGKTFSIEHKQKISKKMKGREFSENHKLNLSLALKGKVFSVETKEKISKTLIGNIPWNKGKRLSEKHIENIRKAQLGKKMPPRSQEQREMARRNQTGKKYSWKSKKKMSNSATNRFANPENHPRWMGGKSNEPYNITFNNKLKKYIKDRDGWICQRCEATKMLVVHHIDYDKQNSLPGNLITICQSCNAKANSKRDFWKKYYHKKLYLILNNQMSLSG